MKVSMNTFRDDLFGAVPSTAVIATTASILLLSRGLAKYLKWRLSPLHKLPRPSQRTSYLFGVFWSIFREPFMAPLQRWIEHYRENDKDNKGPRLLAYSSLLGAWSVAVLDCQIVKEILSDASAYKEQPRFLKKYDFLRTIVGDGLVTLEGPAWSRHRRILQPSFQENHIVKTLDAVAPEIARKLVAAWKKGGDNRMIDVFPHMSAATLDILGQVAFGHDFGGMNVLEQWADSSPNGDDKAEMTDIQDPLLKSIKASFQVSAYNLFLMVMGLGKYVNQLNYKSGRTSRLLDEASSKVIQEARTKFEESKAQSGDDDGKSKLSLIQLMFKAYDTDPKSSATKKTLSDIELRDEVKTFIVAGHETTSSWIYWALYALALHPEIQEKLAHEVANCTPKDEASSSAPPSFRTSHVDEMEYLHAFLTEVLRFYSPVGTIVRFTTREEHWCGYSIPPKTRLVLPIHVLHRSPEYYDRPEEFQPERWLDQNKDGQKNYSFIPFSKGPRNCIGQRFATIEVKILLATILSVFRVRLHESTERDGIRLTNFVAMKSKLPIQIVVEER